MKTNLRLLVGGVVVLGMGIALGRTVGHLPSRTRPQTQSPPARIALRLQHGAFLPASLSFPAGATLNVQNDDDKTYTLEGAGILSGDVPIEPKSTREVSPLKEPGNYILNIEEDPTKELSVTITPSAGGVPTEALTEPLVRRAHRQGRQPVVFDEGHEPAYASYTTFNLTVQGEEQRQEVLQAIHTFCRQLEPGDDPSIPESVASIPEGIRPYFSQRHWEAFQPHFTFIVALGPGCYEKARFGPRVAASKPKDLHSITYSAPLHFDAAATQKDVLVRVTSDSLWFNQQVCRSLWRQLAGKISKPTLDFGYANPEGRTPLLGGFFDGTGNPIGSERDKAVFGGSAGDHAEGGTYVTLFKIRFDEERFLAHRVVEQEKIVGREQQSGRRLPGDKESSHRFKAEGDRSRQILRQGFIYDYTPEERGLLFASLQGSLTKQFEGILRGYMMNPSAPKAGTGQDRLMEYMHFESGGYYFVPPIPKNGYPGKL
ncbi:Dyp-type peroxidase [Armatimonas rosea]|uniref:Dyp-type peroxidase family n=1 Tax=Armatimonas rosea TaxID=685828 RepID=A0A7W9SWT7_ARMRO|nr:Dyp-type peroxidase family [Armatimonas rosea]